MKYTSAYLRQDEKGTWKGFLRYKNDKGKWSQVSRTFPSKVKTEKQAEREPREWRSEMELQAARLDAQDDETVALVFAALEVLRDEGPSLEGRSWTPSRARA